MTGIQLEANKAVVRRFVDEVWNRANYENINALVSRDSILHHYLIGTLTGQEQVLGWIGYARTLVPDAHVTIERLIAAGDQVVMLWTSTGTYANNAGWPANLYNGSGLIVYTLLDGLIVEQWYSADSLKEAQGSNPATPPTASDPARTSDEEAQLQFAIGLHQTLWNDHELSTFDAVFAPTFVNADPAFPDVRHRHEFRQWASDMLAAFPDLYTRVDDAVVDGDTVVLRYRARGTHSGELAGLPAPDGAMIEWTGTVILDLNGHRVQAMWWSRDAWTAQSESPSVPSEALSAEGSQRVVDHALAWVNARDLTTADVYFAPTVAIHSASAQPWTVDYYGLDGAKAYFESMLHAFSDLTFTADGVVAEGGLVAVRWTMRGTFSGQSMGVAGSNQPVEVSGIDLWRVSGGQVVELWRSMDSLSMLRQMGIIPMD
jgi:predicted ester cyclase